MAKSKLDGVVDSCLRQMKKQRINSVDQELLKKIAKSLGPSIYKRDSLVVAARDKKEMATIRNNFLIKKMGCKDDKAIDKAMAKAVKKIGESNRYKMRPVFYYLLVKDLGLEKKFK